MLPNWPKPLKHFRKHGCFDSIFFTQVLILFSLRALFYGIAVAKILSFYSVLQEGERNSFKQVQCNYITPNGKQNQVYN